MRHRGTVHRQRRKRELRGLQQALVAIDRSAIPRDGVRDIPDVSLFAANGVWGHYYVVCYSDTNNGGASCAGTPDTWAGFGGTSVSSPIMAGIQALINQRTGIRQGNPNPTYYSLAAAEYGAGGNPACNSSLGNAVNPSCIFYDVTLGDMDVDCQGSNNCYIPSGTYGGLSILDSSLETAFAAGVGWDFATGIGTVNANNLVMAFGSAAPTPTPTGSPTATATPTRTATATTTVRATATPTLTATATRPQRNATDRNIHCHRNCNEHRDRDQHCDRDSSTATATATIRRPQLRRRPQRHGNRDRDSYTTTATASTNRNSNVYIHRHRNFNGHRDRNSILRPRRRRRPQLRRLLRQRPQRQLQPRSADATDRDPTATATQLHCDGRPRPQLPRRPRLQLRR